MKRAMTVQKICDRRSDRLTVPDGMWWNHSG